MNKPERKTEAFRVVDPRSWDALPEYLQSILRKYSGKGQELLTTMEEALKSLPIDEQQRLSILAFKALGIDLRFDQPTQEEE